MIETVNRKKKIALVSNFKEKIQNKSLVLFHNICLSANDMVSLRKTAKANESEVIVIKNKLAAIALKDQKVSDEFTNCLKKSNIFLICNDVINGVGSLKTAPNNKFVLIASYENQIFTKGENLKECMAYNGFKSAMGELIGKLQEPMVQLQKIINIMAEKSGNSEKSPETPVENPGITENSGETPNTTE